MAKGMEAVLEKTAGKPKKKAVLVKKVAEKLAQGPKKGPKGPGMAVMIAIGAPKKGMGDKMGDQTEETPMRDGFQDRADTSTKAILAKLDARIAALEAKLAESEGEDEEMEDDGEENDMEEED